jgi:hypothetical protein
LQQKTSDNLNKNLCFGTILSEHVSESRSINPFNQFQPIYFVSSFFVAVAITVFMETLKTCALVPILVVNPD